MRSSRSALHLAAFIVMLAIPVAAQDIRVESYQGKDAVAGEILVRFRGVTPVQSQAMAVQDVDIESAEPVGESGAIVLRSRNRNVEALLQAYQSRLDVEYAEPNFVWTVNDLPNDAFFGQQWGLRNSGQITGGVLGIADVDIKARQAWDITEGSRNVVVGVVDTGVDYTHPDLIGNMWTAPTSFTVRINGKLITCAAGTHGFNAITRACDPLDDFGHGTHVAGIIGASGNNGVGVSGVSRVASIMALKFLGSNGFGTTVDAIAAIDFALQAKQYFGAQANVRVLNNSWGGGSFSRALQDEISLANDANVLFVASAGNAAVNNDLAATYPTNYPLPNVLSVAATDNRDRLASFSSWGPTTVDLGAPGVNVLSTIRGGLYGFNSGTSMAAPMVSGAAALVLTVCPLTTPGIKANLLSSVDEIPSLTDKVLTSGRLNLFRAISSCVSPTAPGFTLTVSPGVQSLDPNGSASLNVTAASVGGFTGVINLIAHGLPSGVTATFEPPAITGGSGTSTLIVQAGPNAQGTHGMIVVGNSGGIERRVGVSLELGVQFPSIGLNQTLSGTLTSSDRVSQNQIGSYADYYRLTLPAQTAVTIDMKAGLFDAFLYVLSPTGTVLFANDAAAGTLTNPRIAATLPAGTYIIEATSTSDGQAGGYTLSLNTPTLNTLTPRVIPPGTTATVTFAGNRFTSPMSVTAADGITVNNLNVTSPTLASATISVAADAAPGPRIITVSTAEGPGNPMAFPVPMRIQPGQAIAGSVSTSDLLWPNTLFRYTDLYMMQLSATTNITIDVRSVGFDALVGLFSSTGAVLFSDDDSAGVNADRITTLLTAGTYYIEVTSTALGVTSGDYVIGVNLPGLNSVSPRFIEAGTSRSISLSGSRLAAPMTVEAGDDVVVSNVTVVSPSFATATAASIGVTPGIRNVTATTPAGTTNGVPLSIVPPIPTINVGDTVPGTLSQSDAAALDVPGAYMDLYRFTLSATTRLTINLQSDVIDMNLFILNASGLITALNNDSSGERNASVTVNLSAGSYFIEATSSIDGQEGDYALSLATASLGVTSITPRVGAAGTTLTATLVGAGLASPLSIDAGPGITVTNVVVNSATSATLTMTIAANATSGVRDLSIITVGGVNLPLAFTVLPLEPIALGETKIGLLSPSDIGSVNRVGNYGDVYRLTLTTPASIAINVNSSAFSAYVYLLTPSGEVLAAGSSRVTTVIDAGTYLIDATSASPGVGPYTLSVSTAPITMNFPRALTPAELALTRFSVVNPGGAIATVRFTMYDAAGLVVTTATETITASSQLIKAGSEILPGATRSGWIQATTEIIGVKAYAMGGDLANVMDGAPAAPESSDLLFPVVVPQTELNIANTGPSTNSVLFIATLSGSTTLFATTRTVPTNGVLRITAAALFAGLPVTSIRVTGTTLLAGTAVVPDYLAAPSVAVINGVDASAAASTAFFPQVVSGGGWTSTLSIANASTAQTQIVTVTFIPRTGPPRSTLLILSPRGVVLQSVQTLFGLSGFQEGSIRVTGTSPLTASLLFSAGTATAAVPGQATARTVQIFNQVATGPNSGTGLAFANPSTTTDASVWVYVYRRTGALVGRYNFLLIKGTSSSKLLTEMVPESSADDGFIYVDSNVPIFATEVVFSRDLRTLASIPPDVRDPGVIFLPAPAE